MGENPALLRNPNLIIFEAFLQMECKQSSRTYAYLFGRVTWWYWYTDWYYRLSLKKSPTVSSTSCVTSQLLSNNAAHKIDIMNSSFSPSNRTLPPWVFPPLTYPRPPRPRTPTASLPSPTTTSTRPPSTPWPGSPPTTWPLTPLAWPRPTRPPTEEATPSARSAVWGRLPWPREVRREGASTIERKGGFHYARSAPAVINLYHSRVCIEINNESYLDWLAD